MHPKGVFFLTQALAPLIADGGRIVNFSSQLTRTSFPGTGWLNGRRIEAAGASNSDRPD